MFHILKRILARNVVNARGWKTNRKIIVFESDDWGSIRMPNRKVLNKYINMGYDLKSNPYCYNDTLANSEDLDALFEVLNAYKNKSGHHPKFTFNTVMANPSFDKIRESNFEEYFFEAFPKTLSRYYPKENVFKLWELGIREKFIQPQFHGREHLNVLLWLKMLKEGNQPLTHAFNLEFWGVPKSLYSDGRINIQAAFGSSNNDQFEFYKKNITEGLGLFEDIFGFRSKTFIANNYTYPEALNSVLYNANVVGIQSMRNHKIPHKGGSMTHKKVFTGKQTELGQTYTVRNCMFEPSQMPVSFDNVGNCLKQINNSFFWKCPAIITSHRLNYIGSINQKNRTYNLELLRTLLNRILKEWPDVEFLSSDELIENINKDNARAN